MNLTELIVKLREREGQRVGSGRPLIKHVEIGPCVANVRTYQRNGRGCLLDEPASQWEVCIYMQGE